MNKPESYFDSYSEENIDDSPNDDSIHESEYHVPSQHTTQAVKPSIVNKDPISSKLRLGIFSNESNIFAANKSSSISPFNSESIAPDLSLQQRSLSMMISPIPAPVLGKKLPEFRGVNKPAFKLSSQQNNVKMISDSFSMQDTPAPPSVSLAVDATPAPIMPPERSVSLEMGSPVRIETPQFSMPELPTPPMPSASLRRAPIPDFSRRKNRRQNHQPRREIRESTPETSEESIEAPSPELSPRKKLQLNYLPIDPASESSDVSSYQLEEEDDRSEEYYEDSNTISERDVDEDPEPTDEDSLPPAHLPPKAPGKVTQKLEPGSYVVTSQPVDSHGRPIRLARLIKNGANTTIDYVATSHGNFKAVGINVEATEEKTSRQGNHEAGRNTTLNYYHRYADKIGNLVTYLNLNFETLAGKHIAPMIPQHPLNGGSQIFTGIFKLGPDEVQHLKVLSGETLLLTAMTTSIEIEINTENDVMTPFSQILLREGTDYRLRNLNKKNDAALMIVTITNNIY